MRKKSARRKLHVLVAFGTRPEAIKLAPLIRALKKDRRFRCTTVLTGQHRQMVDQVLCFFRIRPDYDLNLMRDNQDLMSLSHRLLIRLQEILRRDKPDWVIVQGDTTTAFVVAWAAFYEKVPVAHVEAGLRSYDPARPFPEEINRRLISQVARLHFAPTPSARDNLLKEGTNPRSARVTGNTGIDSLLWCLSQNHRGPAPPVKNPKEKLIVVTCHRRESFGPALRQICGAIKELALCRRDVRIVYPVHLNPNVRRVVQRLLKGVPRVRLIKPLSYPRQVQLMSRAACVLTDSGGIQEEAPTLGVPVLVLREVTERPEGVRMGFARVVGVRKDRIVQSALQILSRPPRLPPPSKNPYGDGKACRRILNALLEKS